jgi:hypothetical protein
MKKSKLIGKISGITLVFVMLGAIVCTLTMGLPAYALQRWEGFRGNYEGNNGWEKTTVGGIQIQPRFRVEYDEDAKVSVVTSLALKKEGKDWVPSAYYGRTWTWNHCTLSGHGNTTTWGGGHSGFSGQSIGATDRLVSLPQLFTRTASDQRALDHCPVPAFTYEPPTYVLVANPETNQSRIFRLADVGPALWTGAAIDMTEQAQQDIGVQSLNEVDYEVLGHIFAGTSNPGGVYTYICNENWKCISPVGGLGYSVLALAGYNGHLYAGVISDSYTGQVYKYEGNSEWTLIGDNMDDEVCSLAVYQGDLYAGTAWNGMRLYKYTSGVTNCGVPNWTRVVNHTSWDGTKALYVSNDYLLMGDIGWDWIGRWDGMSFHQDQPIQTGSCIYDFEDYNGNVYGAAWAGRMWGSGDAINWNLAISESYGTHMWELETFRGSLYMSYDNGELRQSNIPDRGTLVYTAPDGIISMTTATEGTSKGKPVEILYFGTGAETSGDGIANIYRYDGVSSPTLVSGQDEMGGGVQVLYFLRPGEVE